MNLMDVLKGQLSDDMLHQLSNHIGAEPEQTSAAAQGVFATLLGGLANNASTETGLSSLGSALDRNHDGSMLDDLMGMVGGMLRGGNTSADMDGEGIVGHVLGDRQEVAAEQISQKSGLNIGQVIKLLPILAPIVMNVLGKTKRSGGLDLGSLAGILMGSAQQTQQQGGMGDLIGSVLGGVLGRGQQQQEEDQAPSSGGGLADVLGGIFGRR